jgi:intergrase/recombinase
LGGTLCKIGSPLLSFLLCSLCTPLQVILYELKNISGVKYMNGYALMTYYEKYLKEICKVSDSTIDHYQRAMRYISKFLVKKEKIRQSSYEYLRQVVAEQN